jgi:hypothetical protein
MPHDHALDFLGLPAGFDAGATALGRADPDGDQKPVYAQNTVGHEVSFRSGLPIQLCGYLCYVNTGDTVGP